MKQIILQVEDNKTEILLQIIDNLKSDLIKSYLLKPLKDEKNDFNQLSDPTLTKIWDNKEDSDYDKFLQQI